MNKLIISIVLIIAVLLSISGCLEKQEYAGDNLNTQLCYDSVNDMSTDIKFQVSYDRDIAKCDAVEILESYNFSLKEMKQKDLMQSEFSGSYLLIGGGIYGRVEDKMYLVVTYFDTRVPAYKITKFDLEQLEINTIDKNETAYFKYKVMPYKLWKSSSTSYFDKSITVLYLPDGWSII